VRESLGRDILASSPDNLLRDESVETDPFHPAGIRTSSISIDPLSLRYLSGIPSQISNTSKNPVALALD
jgi:hypothetical protein